MASTTLSISPSSRRTYFSEECASEADYIRCCKLRSKFAISDVLGTKEELLLRLFATSDVGTATGFSSNCMPNEAATPGLVVNTESSKWMAQLIILRHVQKETTKLS